MAEEPIDQAVTSIAFTSMAIRAGDRGGLDPDEDLGLFGYWLLDVFEVEDLRSPLPVVDNGGHGQLMVWISPPGSWPRTTLNPACCNRLGICGYSCMSRHHGRIAHNESRFCMPSSRRGMGSGGVCPRLEHVGAERRLESPSSTDMSDQVCGALPYEVDGFLRHWDSRATADLERNSG